MLSWNGGLESAMTVSHRQGSRLRPETEGAVSEGEAVAEE